MKTPLEETEINLISEQTSLEGRIVFDRMTRIHGRLRGEIEGRKGSKIVLAESGLIEGNIQGDEIWIDGFVRGDITASTKVVVSGSGRVVGNVITPSLTVEFGAYFEGQCKMPDAPRPPAETNPG